MTSIRVFVFNANTCAALALSINPTSAKAAEGRGNIVKRGRDERKRSICEVAQRMIREGLSAYGNKKTRM